MSGEKKVSGPTACETVWMPVEDEAKCVWDRLLLDNGKILCPANGDKCEKAGDRECKECKQYQEWAEEFARRWRKTHGEG